MCEMISTLIFTAFLWVGFWLGRNWKKQRLAQQKKKRNVFRLKWNYRPGSAQSWSERSLWVLHSWEPGNAAAFAHRASLAEGEGAKAWEAGVRPSCQLGYASDLQWAQGSSVFLHSVWLYWAPSLCEVLCQGYKGKRHKPCFQDPWIEIHGMGW